MDAPFLNCDGCRSTTGRAGCPVHRDPIAPKQSVYTDEAGAYHYTGSTLVMTHCLHGLDLRLHPRCYLCRPDTAEAEAVTAALDALAAEVAGMDKIVYGHPLDDAVYRAAVLAAIEKARP